MSTPRIVASGQGGARDLDDGVHAKLDFVRSSGLIEPAVVSKGASIDTFGGSIRVRASASHYMPRAISLTGILVRQGGYAEGMARLHDFFEALQGANTRIQVGSLYLDCNLGQPRQDRFKGHSKVIDYMVDAEAIPALYQGLYGYAVGVDQGIPVIDDRRDRTELLFGTGTNAMVDLNSNGRVFTVHNPGSAPCDLPLLISGLTASTTYYLANKDKRAGAPVVFSTGSGQTTFYLSPAYKVKCFPGTNYYWLQSDASGTLVTSGTYEFAIVGYPAPWRYLGNDAARFNEGPAIFSLYRRGVATKIDAGSGTVLTTKDDMAPRIGVPSGCAVGTTLSTFLTSSQGLICEQGSTNKCLQSEDFSTTWTNPNANVTVTTNDLAAPDGTNSADKIEEADAATEAYLQQTVSITGDTTWWTFSVFVDKDSTTNRFPEFRFEMSGGTGATIFVQINTSTGASGSRGATGNGSSAITNVYDAGDFWRLAISMQNASNTTATLKIFPAVNAGGTPGDPPSFAATGFIHAWGAQLENLPFCTSYIKTTTAAVARNADFVGIHLPHNYLRHSHDLTQKVDQGTDSSVASDLTKWVCRGPTTVMAVARDATTADGTATGTTLTFNDATDSIFQRIVPDFRPSSSPITFAVTVRKTAGSPTSAKIRLLTSTSSTGAYDQFSELAATTITFADFPDNTSSRTYYVQGTPGATAVDIGAEIIGNSGTGNFVVEHCGVFKGLFPGLCPVTESANIPLPKAGLQWLNSFAQNGYIQFEAVLPTISTGTQYAVVGDLDAGTAYLYLERESSYTTAQNYLKLARRHNGGLASEASIDVVNVWDKASHTYKIWWRNYTTSGTQTMTYGLDIDGANEFTSSDLASSTVTSWSSPERLWLSFGKVFATIRDFEMNAYAVPAGSVPALAV